MVPGTRFCREGESVPGSQPARQPGSGQPIPGSEASFPLPPLPPCPGRFSARHLLQGTSGKAGVTSLPWREDLRPAGGGGGRLFPLRGDLWGHVSGGLPRAVQRPGPRSGELFFMPLRGKKSVGKSARKTWRPRTACCRSNKHACRLNFLHS